MKKHFLAGILLVALLSVAATTYMIDQLTNNATPSNGTVIEVYDPSASPKSGKYTLTNKANATPAGITNALGYVPVNKAGDTSVGPIEFNVTGTFLSVKSQSGISTNTGLHFNYRPFDNGDGTFNETFQWGQNLNPDGGASSVGQVGWGWQLEPNWKSGPKRYSEAHLTFIDTNNSSHRVLSIGVNHDDTNDWHTGLQASEVVLTYPDTTPWYQLTPGSLRWTPSGGGGRSFTWSAYPTYIGLYPSSSGCDLYFDQFKTINFPGGYTSSTGGTIVNLWGGQNILYGVATSLYQTDTSYDKKWELYYNEMRLNKDFKFLWSSDVYSSGTKDLGFVRDSAGVAKITDGGNGNGSLKSLSFIVSGTTNQVVFGATNTAPVSSVAPTKWISVQVIGESTVYRLPLYE